MVDYIWGKGHITKPRDYDYDIEIRFVKRVQQWMAYFLCKECRSALRLNGERIW